MKSRRRSLHEDDTLVGTRWLQRGHWQAATRDPNAPFTTWTLIQPPPAVIANETSIDWQDVFVHGQTDVWAVGGNHVAHFDGATWTDRVPFVNASWYGVWVAGGTTIWICGTRTDTNANLLMYSYDSGATWALGTVPSPGNILYDIWGSPGQTSSIWCRADDGHVFYTENSGLTWTPEPPFWGYFDTISGSELTGEIYFLGRNHQGICSGLGNYIPYTDGWRAATVSMHHAYISRVGNNFYYTTDCGQTVITIPGPATSFHPGAPGFWNHDDMTALDASTVLAAGWTYNSVNGTVVDGSLKRLVNNTFIEDPTFPSGLPKINAINSERNSRLVVLVGNAGFVMAKNIVPPATLTTVLITPNFPTVAHSQSIQFTATAVYSDSTTEDVTAVASWSVGAGSVSALGLYTAPVGSAAQDTSIAAYYSTSGGSSGIHIAYTAPAPTTYNIAPATVTLTYGHTQQFNYIVGFSDGSTQDVTENAGTAWFRNPTGGASSIVSTGTGAGLYTAPTDTAITSADIFATFTGIPGFASPSPPHAAVTLTTTGMTYTSWTVVPRPTTADLQKVWVFGQNDIWATGGSSVVHFDGTAWTEFFPSGDGLASYYGLWGAAPGEIWVSGIHSSDGIIYKSINNGTTWTAVTTWAGLGAPLYELWGTAPSTGRSERWVRNEGGTVYWSSNNGGSWSSESHGATKLSGSRNFDTIYLTGGATQWNWTHAAGYTLMGTTIAARAAILPTVEGTAFFSTTGSGFLYTTNYGAAVASITGPSAPLHSPAFSYSDDVTVVDATTIYAGGFTTDGKGTIKRYNGTAFVEDSSCPALAWGVRSINCDPVSRLVVAVGNFGLIALKNV